MITTHILETATGRPAEGVEVRLDRWEGHWVRVGEGRTDPDGRVRDRLGPERLPGRYRLTFDVGSWYSARHTPTFYPEVSVVFEVVDPGQHHHVPLLLAPWGYSTYRGS